MRCAKQFYTWHTHFTCWCAIPLCWKSLSCAKYVTYKLYPQLVTMRDYNRRQVCTTVYSKRRRSFIASISRMIKNKNLGSNKESVRNVKTAKNLGILSGLGKTKPVFSSSTERQLLNTGDVLLLVVLPHAPACWVCPVSKLSCQYTDRLKKCLECIQCCRSRTFSVFYKVAVNGVTKSKRLIWRKNNILTSHCLAWHKHRWANLFFKTCLFATTQAGIHFSELIRCIFCKMHSQLFLQPIISIHSLSIM